MEAIDSSSDVKTLSFIEDLCEEKQINPLTLLVVSVLRQEMYVFQNMHFVKTFKVSTAKNGIGQVENSFQTPLGLHTIAEKHGDGEDPFTIFEAKEPQQKVFQPNDEVRQIVARILWLKGEEEGFNLGENAQNQVVDSYKRYIYIHGTNQIDKIGTPSSAGCVSLHPHDMVELFDYVEVGSAVYIAKDFSLEAEK